MMTASRRRAMTLVEVLISLAILTALLLVGTAWVQIASAEMERSRADRDVIIAERAVDAMTIALLTGDRPNVERGRAARQRQRDRVTVSPTELVVDTRTAGYGVIRRTFSYDAATQTVRMRDDASNAMPDPIVISNNVSECRFERQADVDQPDVVTITLAVGDTRIITREVTLP